MTVVRPADVAEPATGPASTAAAGGYVQPASVPPALYWAWSLLLLLPLWLPKYLPTEDGLAHLYWVEVYRALGDPQSIATRFFVPHIALDAPHHMVYFALQLALGGVLEPHLAQKVVVSAIVLSWAAAIWFLSRAVSRDLTLGAFAALLLIHSSWTYNGFFAFMGAIPLVLVTIGILARITDGSTAGDRPGPYATVAILGLLAHYAHFFVGAIFLMVGMLWLAFPWRPRRFRRTYLALALLPTAVFGAWYLAGGTLGAGGLGWEPFVRVLARFFGLAFFRGFAGPTPSYWLALTAFAAVIAFLCWRGVRDMPFRALPPTRRFVFLLAGLLGIGYFFAPASVGEAWPLHGRLQYVALAWLLPCLPSRVTPRARLVVLATVSCLLGWQVATFSARGVRFSRAYEGVLRQADAIPPGATLTSMLQYGAARYEGSFVRVLASLPEDIALRRRAILLNSFFPERPYYWVRPRTRVPPSPDYRIDLRTDTDGRIELLVQPTR